MRILLLIPLTPFSNIRQWAHQSTNWQYRRGNKKVAEFDFVKIRKKMIKNFNNKIPSLLVREYVRRLADGWVRV